MPDERAPSAIHEITVPMDNRGDDEVLLIAWAQASGEAVRRGDTLVELETSKSNFDIEAAADGYIFYSAVPGECFAIGDLIAVIAPESVFDFVAYASTRAETSAPLADTSTLASSEGARFSKSAQMLLEEYGLDSADFADNKMVTRDDVLAKVRAVTSLPAASLTKNAAQTAEGTNGNNRVLIVGGGGNAKVCIDLLRSMQTHEIVGIIDASLDPMSSGLGVDVVGGNDELSRLFEEGVRYAVVGFGALREPQARQRILAELRRIGFVLPNLIHPSATVEPSATLGEGNQIMAGAIVGSAVVLHDNCIVNSGAIVSHDCELHDNVHLAPGAILAGDVRVGRNTLVGMGATVYFGVQLGEDVTIGNGSDVLYDVPSGTIVRSKLSGKLPAELDRERAGPAV